MDAIRTDRLTRRFNGIAAVDGLIAEKAVHLMTELG